MGESACFFVLIFFCRLETTEYGALYSVSNGEVLGGTSLIGILTDVFTAGILMPAEDSNAVLVTVEAKVTTSGELTGSKLPSASALEILEKLEPWLSITIVMETSDGSIPHAGATTEVSGFLSTEREV